MGMVCEASIFNIATTFLTASTTFSFFVVKLTELNSDNLLQEHSKNRKRSAAHAQDLTIQKQESVGAQSKRSVTSNFRRKRQRVSEIITPPSNTGENMEKLTRDNVESTTNTHQHLPRSNNGEQDAATPEKSRDPLQTRAHTKPLKSIKCTYSVRKALQLSELW